ncbi:autotransporter assembly complex protein TamA [Jannaschia aquimarina]|uniref:TamA protein n=1 Tax=Jannaschia aquimarina TaxID=935700 RepID=A0A0D1EHU8_9RHOB|nr:autotransporter assembly complex family protein [Jannaschia aquimarina]KIT15405.1 Translocation and assembly module TamA precursor [Jannaschia aquimarina]SNT22777.1 autotransporter secretion outer membrane protein TamA [Jannaschia aquimarina]
MSARATLAAVFLLCAPAIGSAADLTIRLTAAEDELRDIVENASLLRQVVDDDELDTRRDIVAAAQADYARILAALFDQGHFGPVISIAVDGTEAAALPLIGGADPVDQVVVTVDPGPRFLFGQARIGPVPRGTELPPGFAPGEPAGTSILRETVSAGIDAWRADGHAKADLESQDLVARHEGNRLDANLTLAPGPRLSYGNVSVQGAERVRADRIERIADLREGDVFDPEEVRLAAARLQRTGAFRAVSIVEAEEIGPDATLPMRITVEEQLPRRFGVGAEIGSTEGLMLSAFWLHRNLTGLADSLRIEGEVSGIGGDTGGADFSLGFSYNRPATFNAETDLYASGEIERLDQPDFTTDRLELEIGARRIVSDEFEYSYGFGYIYSKTDDAFGEREFSILSLPLSATYDRRDEALNPADGYYIETSLRPFNGFERAGGGARFNADLRGYQGFGGENRDRTVIAARVQLGVVLGPDLEDVPPEWLYFSGGGGTVRGQPFQDLAVELDNGREVGGKSFLGLSGEIRQAVTENIGVVGFVDAGWISPEEDFTGGDSHVGAGLGLRYDTGIGPIRVDLGVPVEGPNDNGGVEIYIGIGQAF